MAYNNQEVVALSELEGSLAEIGFGRGLVDLLDTRAAFIVDGEVKAGTGLVDVRVPKGVFSMLKTVTVRLAFLSAGEPLTTLSSSVMAFSQERKDRSVHKMHTQWTKTREPERTKARALGQSERTRSVHRMHTQ